VQVDVDDLMPVLGRVLVDRRRVGDARVVEEHVHTAEPLDGPFDRRLDVVLLGDVAADGQRIAAEPADPLCRLFARALVDVGAHYVGARLGHRL